jgi:hypothetical protein
MRRGYWRTLLGRLRDKVASGENTFFHQEGVFVVARVTAQDEAELELGGELRLAEDELGSVVVLEIATAQISIVYAGKAPMALAEDLLTFINSLRSLAPPGLTLGSVVDEAIDLPRPRGGILDDD